MKYYATIEGKTYEIVIDHPGKITVNGVDISADMRRLGRLDHCSLLIDHLSHEVVVEQDAEERSVYGVLVSGTRFEVKVEDERSHHLARADRRLRAPGGDLAIKAPIPGLVVKVPVAPGQSVAEGEALVILEAMKMENELRAPRAGTVHEVRVEPGRQVGLGQVLVTLK